MMAKATAAAPAATQNEVDGAAVIAGAGDDAGATEGGAGDDAGATEGGAGDDAGATEGGAGDDAGATEGGAGDDEYAKIMGVARIDPEKFITFVDGLVAARIDEILPDRIAAALDARLAEALPALMAKLAELQPPSRNPDAVLTPLDRAEQQNQRMAEARAAENEAATKAAAKAEKQASKDRQQRLDKVSDLYRQASEVPFGTLLLDGDDVTLFISDGERFHPDVFFHVEHSALNVMGDDGLTYAAAIDLPADVQPFTATEIVLLGTLDKLVCPLPTPLAFGEGRQASLPAQSLWFRFPVPAPVPVDAD
jgi:hypothetical protein